MCTQQVLLVWFHSSAFHLVQAARLRSALAEREAQLGDLQDQHLRLVVGCPTIRTTACYCQSLVCLQSVLHISLSLL